MKTPQREIYDHYLSIGKFGNSKGTPKVYEQSYYMWKSYLGKYISNYDREGSRVLDIGCGLGQNLSVFSKLGFKQVEGIDVSQENIDFLNKYDFDVRLADAFKYLKETDKEFDIISMFDVIEHFTKAEIIEILSLIKSRLKPGGVLIIHTLNAQYPFWKSIFFADITHETALTPQSLDQFLNLAGFGDSTVVQINSFYLWHPNVIKRALRRLFLYTISAIVELAYRLLALSQGITLRNCKPNLISISYKK
ncbi:MAG: class I SAM-dependent methyltransferase [Candidatus Taylorbacteria bacterium]